MSYDSPGSPFQSIVLLSPPHSPHSLTFPSVDHSSPCSTSTSTNPPTTRDAPDPQLIVLDSPPGSPIFTNNAIDHSSVVKRFPDPTPATDALTPLKRCRKKRTQGRKHWNFSHTSTNDIQEVRVEPSDYASNMPPDLFDYNTISRRSPSPSTVAITNPLPTEEDEYERYVNLVLADCLPFYQISSTIYVVQGWNRKNNKPTSYWHHLQRKRIGEDWAIACFCPFSGAGPCVHWRFVQDHGEEHFSKEDLQLNCDTDEFILFSRQAAGDNSYLNHFSVVYEGQTSVKNRAVVSYRGDDTGSGTWVCQKDRGNTCSHIKHARHGLQKLVQADPTARDKGAHKETGLIVPRVHEASARDDKAISYLPIQPPIWASLPDDRKLYSRPLPIQTPPEKLFLDEGSSCSCSAPRTLYSPFLTIQERTCIIYTSTQALQTTIQLQTCPTCVHHFIGPEPRNLGLFNFNNQILFSHNLLDEYTSAFTSSETPFAAWVVTASRRYQVHQSCVPFVSEKMFRSVWFTYTHLQCLDTNMHCPKCGQNPKDTIWD